MRRFIGNLESIDIDSRAREVDGRRGVRSFLRDDSAMGITFCIRNVDSISLELARALEEQLLDHVPPGEHGPRVEVIVRPIDRPGLFRRLWAAILDRPTA